MVVLWVHSSVTSLTLGIRLLEEAVLKIARSNHSFDEVMGVLHNVHPGFLEAPSFAFEPPKTEAKKLLHHPNMRS